MRRLISYLDLTAPKFNLFINGKSRYRTFSGGIFHLLTGLTIIILTVNILIDFSKHENPSIVINTSEYTPDLIRNKIRINQNLTIQVHKELNEHHVFSVAGSFIDKNNSQMIRSEDNISSITNTYVLNLSNINFSDTEYFFISFPRCNNDTYLCENPNNTSDEAYKNFTDGEKSLYFFNLEIPRLKINLYNYTDKFETEYQKKSIYVNKKRGVYYLINLNLIVVDETKSEFLNFSFRNQSYGFSVENIEQIAVDDYSWSEYSYSIFIKLNKVNSVTYHFTYKNILNVFSDIGGIANCFSFLYTIKNILSLHFADIFMINYNFFNNINEGSSFSNNIIIGKQNSKFIELSSKNSDEKNIELIKDSSFFKNDIDEKEFNVKKNDKKQKNNYQSNFVYDKSNNFLNYFSFMKYKIFKCCLKKDKSQNLYLNYKWILDINYLLRIYLQMKLLKGVLLTPNQRRLLENLSLIEKIDVYSRLNMDNFYLQNPIKNEEEREQLIEQEIDKFLSKKSPYQKDDLDKDENSFIKKLLEKE